MSPRAVRLLPPDKCLLFQSVSIGGRDIPTCPDLVPGIKPPIDVCNSLTSLAWRGDSRAIKLICCVEIIGREGLLGLWLKMK